MNGSSESNLPPRRLVIGQNEEGRSAVILDGPAEPAILSQKYPDVYTGFLWKEGGTMDVSSREDQLANFREVGLPVGGTRFFWNELGPGVKTVMHTTETIEYHYVLAGRIILELEDGSVEAVKGDTIVMRGVPHAWHNPSDDETWVSFATMIDMHTSF